MRSCLFSLSTSRTRLGRAPEPASSEPFAPSPSTDALLVHAHVAKSNSSRAELRLSTLPVRLVRPPPQADAPLISRPHQSP